jgi:predicted membrane protein (TIGR00267 family)
MLSLVLGLSEGILTVLTFTAGRLMNVNAVMTWSLAVRISIGVLASGVFMYFVSNYSELRSQLVQAERQLNLTTHGKLVTTHLGRRVLLEAIVACVIASVSAFMGAFIPLLMAIVLPQYREVPIIVALLMLGLLGVGLAKALYGSVIRWSVLLILSGLILWYAGTQLHIV